MIKNPTLEVVLYQESNIFNDSQSKLFLQNLLEMEIPTWQEAFFVS